jgi:hypothetical protein
LKTTIRESEYAGLWYHPEAKVVHHRTYKFMPAGIFQDFLTAGAECLEQNKATKWLSDDRQNTMLRKDDFDWGRSVWAPRVVRAGLKFWAVVHRPYLIGQLRMSGTIEEYSELGVTIEVFEHETEAWKWLESSHRVTRAK